MAPQSIFRKPEAKHYSVLHRSQRDPLINDPSNGGRILHEIHRKNQHKLPTQNQPEPSVTSKIPEIGSSAPSSYNIFYDDPDYDYLQHLRPIGTSTDAIFIGKPDPNSQKKSLHRQPISTIPTDNLLPNSVQPTPEFQTLSYRDHLEFALPSNSAIPDDSLLPISDDPALREVLDALEDEAYVEEDTDDKFFNSIIEHGEIEADEPLDEEPGHRTQSQWESEISRFKSTKFTPDQFDDTSSTASEVLSHQKLQPIQRKSKQSATSARGSFAGSAFSMSSSAMFRNEGLTDLDDRFDQIEKEYQSDDDDDDESDCSEMTTTPKVREDFEAIMDEFLDRFEVLGGKMKPALEGKTPMEKLNTLRAELLGPSSHDACTEDSDILERQIMKEKILSHLKHHQERAENAHIQSSKTHRDTLFITDLDDDSRYENKWDCQTILSTYSNLENHPRVIKIREAIGESKKEQSRKSSEAMLPKSGGKIGIDRTTGFPIVDGKIIKPSAKHISDDESDNASTDAPEGDDSESTTSVIGIIKRDRNEDKESKKIRKAEVKAERAARRQIKKSTKQNFINEKNKQDFINSKLLVKKSVDIAGVGGKHVMSLI